MEYEKYESAMRKLTDLNGGGKPYEFPGVKENIGNPKVSQALHDYVYTFEALITAEIAFQPLFNDFIHGTSIWSHEEYVALRKPLEIAREKLLRADARMRSFN